MKTRVLVLCDDQWHPAETVRPGLDALAESQFEFEFLADGSRWSPMMMKDFPLVIVAKANHICATNQKPWLTAETQSAFGNFVRAGGGLLLVHAGICYKDLAEMRSVIGGVFLHHPDQCLVTIEPNADHPLTNGVAPFTVRDEHYFVETNPDAEIFLYSRSVHGVQPAGWTRTENEGRVCALTPGHNLEVWLAAGFQKILVNALRWTAKSNQACSRNLIQEILQS